jgi:hypothetical protein
MKKALISPQEKCLEGYRVAWVNNEEIPHALPLFWVNCLDDVVQDQYWYDPSDEQIKLIPVSSEPTPEA